MSEFAKAGSQKWLQVAVERKPEVLLQVLRPALALASDVGIEWVSPRRLDGFKEYKDMGALRALGVDTLPHRPLNDFWPQGGPRWDALGRTSDGQYLFVEAKANIPEAASPATRASRASFELIKRSLEEARKHYAPKAAADWSGTFYQYANRLAHHYFLRTVNQLPAHLVFLYFINADDVDGPKTELEWQGAIHLLHTVLGLGHTVRCPGVHEIIVDVNEISGGSIRNQNSSASIAVESEDWFIETLPPVKSWLNKQDVLYRRALNQARKWRGSGVDPRVRLGYELERNREQLVRSVSSAAREEFTGYNSTERRRIHSEGRWKHEEARLLHMAFEQMTVHTSYAKAIVEAWFGDPSFDVEVQAYLDGHLAGRALVYKAMATVKRLKHPRAPKA